MPGQVPTVPHSRKTMVTSDFRYQVSVAEETIALSDGRLVASPESLNLVAGWLVGLRRWHAPLPRPPLRAAPGGSMYYRLRYVPYEKGAFSTTARLPRGGGAPIRPAHSVGPLGPQRLSVSTGSGTRTHTSVRTTDFESIASTIPPFRQETETAGDLLAFCGLRRKEKLSCP